MTQGVDQTVVGVAAAGAVQRALLRGTDGREVEVTSRLRVGRSADCELVLDDERVSRQHALLSFADGRLVVEDRGSTNGTSVNGQRITAPVTLAAGDRLAFDRHEFTVELPGAPGSDATVVGSAPADVTLVGAAPAAQQPSGTPGLAPAASALPGSWVESGTADGTQVLGAAAPAGAAPVSGARASDLAHLADSKGNVYELPVAAGSESSVWEIGRESGCEIALPDPAVSARHAQLVQQGGRWKLVNLVSTNGIYVNGEKKLTAFLADGDNIRLGNTALVFHTALAPAAASPAPAAAGATAPVASRKTWLLVAVAVAIVAAVATALLFS